MEIKIDEPLKGAKSHPIFFGNKSRIPSHTDVKFVSKTKLVIANRFAGKLYLVELKNKTHTLLHTLQIKYKGIVDTPDLIDVSGNTIYIVNLNNILHIVEIKLDMLFYVKSVVLHPSLSYHGLHAYQSKVFAVSTVSETKSPLMITEYTPSTNGIRHLPITGTTHRMKDIIFLNTELAVILTSCHDRQIGLGKAKEIYDGEIHVCSFDGSSFTVIDTKFFEGAHIDSVAVKENTIYCTATIHEKGSFLIKVKIEEKKLEDIEYIPTPPFAHGIDIFEDTLALACYGTHSTFLYPLEDGTHHATNC